MINVNIVTRSTVAGGNHCTTSNYFDGSHRNYHQNYLVICLWIFSSFHSNIVIQEWVFSERLFLREQQSSSCCWLLRYVSYVTIWFISYLINQCQIFSVGDVSIVEETMFYDRGCRYIHFICSYAWKLEINTLLYSILPSLYLHFVFLCVHIVCLKSINATI